MSKEQQVLALGILSLVCCSVLGPFAWFQANEALAMIDHGGYSPVERNLVAAGQVCGMIGTGLLVLGILAVLVQFASGHYAVR